MGRVRMSKLAAFSENCPIACRARKSNKIARWLLKYTGRHICPFCKAYEKKHGKPAYE
jgi:hypothetical protein